MRAEFLCNKGRPGLFSKKVNVIFFVFSLLLGITGILLCIFAPGWSSPVRTLGEYLQLFLVPAVILLAIIGFQKNIRNEFFKSLFHGYLILLIFIASAFVVLTIVLGHNIDGFVFFRILFIYIFWSVLIFLFPMSIVLFFVRKVKSKKHRRMGYGIAIIVFGTVFHICHYFIMQEIAGAIGAAAVMGPY